MRIVPGAPGPEVPAVTAVAEVARSDAASVSASAAAASGSDALQSAVLQPALVALSEMPDIDNARVMQLRDALAKGELPFDARKLAALIESYHRGGK